MSNSDELDLKVLQAVHRIEDLYHETGGHLYVSFSGGKDSTVLLALIKLSVDVGSLPKNGIKAVFCDTGVEMKATRDFVEWCKLNWYENIEIIRPKKSLNDIIIEYGKPIKSKMKSEYLHRYKVNNDMKAFEYLSSAKNPNTGKNFYKTKIGDKDLHMLSKNFSIKPANKCCNYLKKKPFHDYNVQHSIKGYMVGIRSAEGGARELATAKRLKNGGKICTYSKDGVTVKAPIIDWSDSDVEMFIEVYNVPLSKAYTVYAMDRTGCCGCPFARDLKNNLYQLYKFEPGMYKVAMHYFRDVYIAQNVILDFDAEYEKERLFIWLKDGGYFDQRLEMLEKLRPNKIKPSYTDKGKFK